MALDIDTLLGKLVTHAATTGHFDSVNTHEPDNAPGNGVTCNVVLDRINFVPGGLSYTSARVAFAMSLMYPTDVLPRDDSEAHLVKALDAVMRSLNGDFTLGGTVRMVDIGGAHGEELSTIAGYVKIQEQVYRVMEITIPLIVNDVWEEIS